ncbi:MAG TPA: BRO family protein [Oscillospiraceae bacterium]|nr:BRO family protein [Oscillospiraceae bacterium]
MNDLKVFKNTEFGELGVLMIEGKEYFPATQCAKILGYTNPQKAIRDHCKGVNKTFTPTAGGVQEIKFIPEGDLYRLIVSSKLPAAEKFERWIFDEVLPEIRRTGSYGRINLEEIIAKTATAVVAEVVRQLVPVLTVSTARPTPAPHIEEMWEQPIERKRYRKPMGIISHLDEELRREIDNMLISEQYTLREVKAYLEEYGIRVSLSSVGRYSQKLHEI